MELYIDTTEKGEIKLALFRNKASLARETKSTEKISEDLLPFLKKFLEKNKIKLENIKAVSVNPGPGAFSAVRTGVVAANALNFALGLSQKIILPRYNKSPNITPPRLPLH